MRLPLLMFPKVDVEIKDVRVEVNTRASEVTGDFNFGAGPKKLTLPGGPYVRVALLETSLTLKGLSVADSAAKISGNFFFDQAGGVIRLAMSEVKAAVGENGNANLNDGSGALVITADGVAGVVQGTVDASLEDIEADAESTIFLRINNTGKTVNEVIRLGEREVSVVFVAGEENVFQVTLDGFSLNIADIVSIEGSFSFQPRGDRQVSTGQGVSIFIGEGPALLADGKENPEARGILIKDSTVGIVKENSSARNKTLYAVTATGTIKVIGMGDVSITGTISVRINMFTEAIEETIVFPGDTGNVDVVFSEAEVAKPVDDDIDPFVLIEGVNMQVEISEQMIAADVSIGRYTNADGDVVRVSLNNARAAFGTDAEEILILNNAEGDLLLLKSGAALSVDGKLRFGVPHVLTTADFKLEINKTEAGSR